MLEQVQRRELTRVIINVPPRHLKSSQVVKWEAKLLGDDPTEQIISASRALNLAFKFSKQVRRTLQSSRYQSLYPDTKIVRGSDSADDWLVEGGYGSSYRAVGTGGGIVGEGATVLVMDDVSDPGKQESETETTGTWEWYKEEARPRLAPNGVVVVVNNRTGVNDLTAYLLDPERNDSADPPYVWTVVNMPAQDVEGNYLWLDRFPIEFYLSLQNDIHLWNVQYQQKPTLETGNLIKREWFEYVERLPDNVQWRVRAWDCAFTEKQTQKHDPDWTATCKSVVANTIMYLGSPELFRKSIDDLPPYIAGKKLGEPSIRYGMGSVAIKTSIVKAMTAAGQTISSYDEDGDKVTRAGGWIPLAAKGRIKLVGTEDDWKEFMSQMLSFPAGHDDAVDCISGCASMQGFYYNGRDEARKAEQTQRQQIETMRNAFNPNADRYMGEFAPKATE